MHKYTTFSPRCSLVMVGVLMRQWGIWSVVEKWVHVRQKTVKHSPLEKLLDAFITILAGGQGLWELNTRVRPGRALQRAFGRTQCADQSPVSRMLDCCVEDNVIEMRHVNRDLPKLRWRVSPQLMAGLGYRHPWHALWRAR